MYDLIVVLVAIIFGAAMGWSLVALNQSMKRRHEAQVDDALRRPWGDKYDGWRTYDE